MHSQRHPSSRRSRNWTIAGVNFVAVILVGCSTPPLEDGGTWMPNSQSASGTSNASQDTPPPPTLGSLQIFPADNPWNQDVSGLPVHPNSANYLATIGLERGLHPDFGTVWKGTPIGIPYVVHTATSPASRSASTTMMKAIPDHTPFRPTHRSKAAPMSTAIATSSSSIRTTECSTSCTTHTHPAMAGPPGPAPFRPDLKRPAAPAGWTSANAAGLPIFPGLARYDEIVEQGELRHALHLTVSQSQRAYIAPARHFAASSTDPNRPPMGLRVRLKASFDVSPYPPCVQVILRGLKRYGMIVADNGSNWYVFAGAPDPHWNDDELGQLRNVKGHDFEVVYTGPLVTD